MAIARSAVPPPLPGCTPLFDAAAMREADQRAGSDHRMPSLLLMERAGLASAQAILRQHADAGAALVLVGTGNNGGDGWVVARHLAEAGWAVEVAAPGGEPSNAPDAAAMAAIAATLGLHVSAFHAGEARAGGRVLVDALLGTGASGAPRGALGEAVGWLAQATGSVVSLDLPSGVEADSGRVPGVAVRAGLTVTYHGDLVGLRVEPGRGHAGRVEVADIGIPSAVALSPRAWLAGAGAVAAVPARAAAGDKYAAGSVLVVAGSPGLTGAGALCARAAMRAGAGLCVAAVPQRVQPLVAAGLLEVMCVPVPDAEGHLAPASLPAIRHQAARADALALGPGLGRAEVSGAALRELLESLQQPAVVDADGLWQLGPDPRWLAERPGPTVLTPHAGEAARLLGVDRAQVEAGRLAAARELAERTGAVTVLKGAGTITAAPDGSVVVNGTGTPALATAGTGDVLTGVVAAFLATGLDPLVAAAAAVAAHGAAGERADRGPGTVAGDLLDALPAAVAARR